LHFFIASLRVSRYSFQHSAPQSIMTTATFSLPPDRKTSHYPSPKATGSLSSDVLIERSIHNPILQARDVPYPSSLVFNAGVAKYEGRYVMLFRNDYGISEQNWLDYRSGKGPQPGRFETNLGLATSVDGVRWEVAPTPRWKVESDEIFRVYDPRITVIEGVAHICFAMDTRHGVRAGIAKTTDFDKFEIISLSTPDNRNMVLFSEKIDGNYYRLERPFPVYSTGGNFFDIWGSQSPDLRYWGDHELVLAHEQVPFCNDKIGPAAPPLRTARGWLTTFHSVWNHGDQLQGGWEGGWNRTYYPGLMLLDLENPSRVIGMSPTPLWSPEAPYEADGFRSRVIFPGGLILENSGEVKIYYGASDSVEALATAHIDDLLALCLPVTKRHS
jgi:beta-1,4-mannooligosaccharide/beta-1,4-mannosyl-N-acetylglucosamine phosphorylase